MASIKWKGLDKPPLSSPVLEVLAQLGFEFMTAVQTATIPLLLACKDVSVEAVTGSGKTLAFLVPLLEILQHRQKEILWESKNVGAIIISPTRELANQIYKVLETFLRHECLNHFRHVLIVGGNNIEDDISGLMRNGPLILICTPGRLLDLFSRKGNLNLQVRVKSLELLVLDEADRLLDLGFETTINKILSYLPHQRRTGLFSATQTKKVTDLIRAGLRNPVFVSIKEKSSVKTPASLNNFFQIVEPNEKFVELLYFLRSKHSQGKVIVFLSTCACVEYWLQVLPRFLPERTVLGLHGKLKKTRARIVKTFRQLTKAVLLCTDVVARGLDLPEINWVIQWDPPSNLTSFVHRVGRTARQGSEGNALVYLLPSEDAYVTFLKINQKVQLQPWTNTDSQEGTNKHSKLTLQKLHQLQASDKAVFDKGVRAFVSYIRAYTKHECCSILRLKDMDIGKAATGYGLLRMPCMPELKELNASNFVAPDFKVDISELTYKNLQKEKARKEKLQFYNENGQWPKRKVFRKRLESWELAKRVKKYAKSKKEDRRIKQQQKKDNPTGLQRKRKHYFTHKDVEELTNEIRLIKKLRQKGISKKEN